MGAAGIEPASESSPPTAPAPMPARAAPATVRRDLQSLCAMQVAVTITPVVRLAACSDLQGAFCG